MLLTEVIAEHQVGHQLVPSLNSDYITNHYYVCFSTQISLTNKTLSDVHQTLQNCPQITSLTIEYDVSIMESVKLATGPLLIEIERPCNEDLGLFLSNQRVPEDVYGSGSDTYQRVGTCNAIYIDSILPASISDR